MEGDIESRKDVSLFLQRGPQGRIKNVKKIENFLIIKIYGIV